ncbi:MAG: tyrosine-protein phosphatase, partial [Stackebrandtia sp.]
MTTSHAYGSERFVPFESIFNFRDLGGLPAMGGGKVRTGLVFRSDQFGNASDGDINYIVDELGLKTVVDLRRDTEIAATASFPGDHGVEVRHL